MVIIRVTEQLVLMFYMYKTKDIQNYSIMVSKENKEINE